MCQEAARRLLNRSYHFQVRKGASLLAQALNALDRPKGAVPKELDNFTYSNFERRLHKIVDAIMLAADVARKRAIGQ
jgi:hypothetical protein